MTTVKCLNCGYTNSTSENFCLNCGTSIANLTTPNSASLSPPQNQTFESYGFNVPSNFNAAQYDNALGRKVFFWYRVFCGLIALASLLPIILGVLAILGSGIETTPREKSDAITGGIMFIVYGVFYLIPYAVALVYPRKPGHWIFGIILIALSLTSCLFLPFAIPLFIFWLKPETKAYLGRSF